MLRKIVYLIAFSLIPFLSCANTGEPCGSTTTACCDSSTLCISKSYCESICCSKKGTQKKDGSWQCK